MLRLVIGLGGIGADTNAQLMQAFTRFSASLSIFGHQTFDLVFIENFHKFLQVLIMFSLRVSNDHNIFNEIYCSFRWKDKFFNYFLKICRPILCLLNILNNKKGSQYGSNCLFLTTHFNIRSFKKIID